MEDSYSGGYRKKNYYKGGRNNTYNNRSSYRKNYNNIDDTDSETKADVE